MRKPIIKLIFLVALLASVLYVRSIASAQSKTVKIYRSASDKKSPESPDKACTSASLELYKHMYIQIPWGLEEDNLNPDLKVNIYELMKRWCKEKTRS